MDYIPTTGELAAKCLGAFKGLKASTDEGVVSVEDGRNLELTDELVVSVLGLMRKLPRGAKEVFGSTLPFNAFELGLLAVTNLQEHPPILAAVANRFWDWIAFGSLYTNRQAACADFLNQLTPMLDLWDEREQAQALAVEFEAAATADVYTASRHGPIRET